MVAAAGAGPWPQITSTLPLCTSCTMTGTSPPGPLRCGSTTCSVKAVAAAASKALPPRSSIDMPTAVAIQWVEVTTPKVPSISGRVVKGLGLTLLIGGTPPHHGGTRDAIEAVYIPGPPPVQARELRAGAGAVSRGGGQRLVEAVQGRRVIDEKAMTQRFGGRPVRDEVEQHGVVGLRLLIGVRPVAAPYDALGGALDIGLAHLVHIGISGWPDLGAVVGDRELHPGAALVDQPADDLVGGVRDACRLRDVPHVIEHHRGREPVPKVLRGGDLFG